MDILRNLLHNEALRVCGRGEGLLDSNTEVIAGELQLANGQILCHTEHHAK